MNPASTQGKTTPEAGSIAIFQVETRQRA